MIASIGYYIKKEIFIVQSSNWRRISMNHSFANVYFELLSMRADLKEHLNHHPLSEDVKRLAEEELADIERSLEKWKKGNYGICEETGELIPSEVLMFQPLIRSIY